MTRYLIVCGDTGKNLVDKRKILGFDGVLYIDVAASVVNDPLTYTLSLPIEGDVISITSDALGAQMHELEILIKHEEKILRLLQKQYTPQIELYEKLLLEKSTEEHQLEQELQKSNDLSTATPLREQSDRIISQLRTELHEYFELRSLLNSDSVPYIQIKQSIHDKKLQHTLFANATKAIAPIPITIGMSLMPLISSAYFNRGIVLSELTNILHRMIEKNLSHNPNGLVEIFIVASTSSGIGAGISNHVVHHVNNYFVSHWPISFVTFKCIRFGSGIYGQGGVTNSQQTNTAMAVLHDAALAYNQTLKARNQVCHKIQFCYIEMPNGNQIDVQQQHVELAVQAIVRHPINTKFEIMFNSTSTDWFNALFVRTGYWSKVIDHDTLYSETLNQLSESLRLLLTPNYVLLNTRLQHHINNTDQLSEWLNSPFIELVPAQQILKDNLIRSRNGYHSSFHVDNVMTFLSSAQWQTSWDAFTNLMTQYVGLTDKSAFGAMLTVKTNAATAPFSQVTFSEKIANRSTPEYIAEIRIAHEVVACVSHALTNGNGLLTQLFVQWQALAPSMFESPNTYRIKLQEGIKAFAQTYFCVRSLLELLDKAQQRINDAHNWLDVLMHHIAKQQVLHPLNPTAAILTRCASLDLFQNGVTWLASLRNVLVDDLYDDKVARHFKDTVIWGVRGLTRQGLRHIMNISQESTAQAIVAELNSHCGRNNQDEEAPWWQGQQFEDNHNRIGFELRILPNLSIEDNHEIESVHAWNASSGQCSPIYITTHDVDAGLRILAIECSRTSRKLMPVNDVSELLQPLLHSIQRQTTDHNDDDYLQRLAIASTGAPIYVNEYLAHIISPHIDIRKHFLIVDSDESPT